MRIVSLLGEPLNFKLLKELIELLMCCLGILMVNVGELDRLFFDLEEFFTYFLVSLL